MQSVKLLLGLIFLLVLITGCEQGANYEIVDNSVLINDSNLYLKATPHTLTSSGWVETELESKLFSGEIDFAFGFDTDNLKPKRLQIYDPHEEDITHSYTCNYDFNYTTNPNYFTCYSNNDNGTIVYKEGSFDWGNLQTQTAYWNETIETEWRDWNVLDSIDYEFDGKNKWYYSTNKYVTAGQTYKIRYYLEVSPETNNAKYDLAIKPSSETIEEAIENGHFYYLDPWADYNLDDGNSAYWSFDDNTGVWSDVSGHDWNGTITGATFTSPGIVGNGSYLFDENDIMEQTSSLEYPVSGDNDWTISFWINYTQLSGEMETFGTFRNNAGYTGWTITKVTNEDDIFFGTYSGSTWEIVFQTNNVVDIGEPMMITYTRNSSDDLQLYKNGTLVDSFESSDSIQIGSDNLAIGIKNRLYADMDDIGIWNRTLNESEISNLWNNGDGLVYDSPSAESITITDLNIQPEQVYASTGDLNCSTFVTTSTGNNYNITFNWTNSTDFLQTATSTSRLNGTYSSNNLTGHGFKVGEIINCSVFVFEQDNSSISSNSSITTTVLQTIPTWVDVRTNISQYHTQNISIDFNCTDPDGAESYYISNFTGNLQSPLTIDESTGIIYHNPTYNDTGQFDYNVTCVQGGVNISNVLNITLQQNIFFGQNVEKNPISEGSQQIFHFDIGITNYSYAPIGMTLQYNGSNYSVSPSSGTEGNTNYYNYSKTLFISDNEGEPTGLTQTYNWTFNLTDVFTNFESNQSNFTIYSVSIDDCSVYTTPILNLTLKDEKNNTLLYGDIEVDIDLASWNNLSLTWNYSKKVENKSELNICVPDNLLNFSDYMIEITTQYSAPSTHSEEFFFLDYGNLSSLDTFNSYTYKTINLMDLLLDDSTTVLFRYFDQSGLQVDDVILIAYRKYVGEGLFREVERAKQDDNGLSTLHLVEEDALYYYTVTQNGTILFTSETSNVKCTEAICSVNLEASDDFIPFDDDYDLVDDAFYSITTDSGTRTATLTFEGESQANWSLELYKYQNNPDEAIVVNQSQLISTAGTVVVYAPQTAGNITFVVRLRKDGELLNDRFVDFSGNNLDIFRTAGGTFLGAMVVLAMGLMAVTEGAVVIVFFIIGLAITGILGLLEFNWTAFILVSLLGGLLLWKLSKKQV